MASAPTEEYKLSISHAFHKADIDFSEDGVKAAAVTVFVSRALGAPKPKITYPIDIIINKPFMFIIRDKATKDIWFTGTVYEPNLWEENKATYNPVYTCIAASLGYPCCQNTCKVVYNDGEYIWGVENGDWCGLDYGC